MKKTILFSSALVALAMLASCQKEQLIETPATATGVTEFSATIDQPTKTAIDSYGKVTWVEGDEITVTDSAEPANTAVYVAQSSGASTTFSYKSGTAVTTAPYKATYGDYQNQVYSPTGANCPLTAESETDNFTFSSPYAVVKLTAKSSDAELVKTVVVKYGNSSSILDCQEGVTLTPAGVDFYVAVCPSTESAALSVSFYTAGKMATKVRKSPVSLAAKDLLPVTFESLPWSAKKTFKAVLNAANTLTFYYDAVDHSGDGTVYEDGTTNYLFDKNKSNNQKWGYYGKSLFVTSVVIDSSVADYPFLTSTTFMFFSMRNATAISGAEYLDVSNVTDMSYMFTNFGLETTTFNVVPDVSGWNTGNVTNTSNMFNAYGKQSTVLAEVPNVKVWNTEQVKDMSNMFKDYGNFSTVLNKVPDVSGWNTVNVANMSGMFQNYGYKSTKLEKVPNVSGWKDKTGKVENMSDMFNSYGYTSTALTEVPDVSKWKTDNVTKLSSMFKQYGYSSTALNKVPDVSIWETGNVNKMDSMFDSYGYLSTGLTEVPDVSIWETAKVTDWSNIFSKYGHTSTLLATVPDVSDWENSSVLEIDNMFYEYGNSSKVIVCNLDLSGWDLSKVTQAGLTVFQFKAKTFNVTIPAKTGTKDNDSSHWYYDIGDLFIQPAGKPEGETGKHVFTLASN